MPLDPQCQVVLDQLATLDLPPIWETDPETARRAMAYFTKQQLGQGESIADVSERSIPGGEETIRIRVYRPEGDGPLPVIVFFHGGGWVIGDLDTHDVLVRRLTNASGCLVVSVDYRLAPDHKYPAGLEDCYAAVRWVAEGAGEIGGDGARIAVVGDSAGGNLAAAVTLLARERGGPAIAQQTLYYPVTDHNFDRPSYRDNAQGYLLERQSMHWFWGHYLASPADVARSTVCVLRASDLSRLPPALIITAEFDPLRDEGELYARRLQEAGVRTTLVRYDGMIHDFVRRCTQIEAGLRAVRETAEAVNEAFGDL